MFFKRVAMYLRFLRSMFRVNKGLLWGMWKLTKLPQPAITVFGGTKLPVSHPTAKIISALTKKLAHAGFSIITGGGPGIMEAANLGALEHANHKKKPSFTTIGIGLTQLQTFNKYVQDNIIQPYFFTRKWLLVRYSVGFIVGPGGFGTLDELTEVLTLIQTHQMPKTPVVLINKSYWQPFLNWVHEHPLKEKLLSKKDAHILTIADTAEEAFEIIQKNCGDAPQCSIEAPPTEKKSN
ncbi:TIGR00730 family Rossman fold protein [Candidatus Babeliales bacterium]|nr:TIGR00730 family Rossman fold protein [Candidatus Babeliales bacterium]